MGWSIGYDNNHRRDIGYGVPAYCDHPECGEEIDRGLAYVCGEEPYGGDYGCGLFFCAKHQQMHPEHDVSVCERCAAAAPPFAPGPDHPRWIAHKLTHESWARWRDGHPAEVAAMRDAAA